MSTAASEGLSRTLVLNGLRDVVGEADVLADEQSRETLSDAFEDALHVAERDRFATAVVDALSEELDDETDRFLQTCADDVLQELIDREVTATLTHDVRLSVPPHEAAVYSFMVSRAPEALADITLADAVRERVDAGAEAIAAGEFEQAVEAFDDAVTESGGGDGSLTTRVLAGYACHLAGRDDDAMHYVEETLHLDTGLRTAKLLGYAADHRYPEKFRSGKLGSRFFFRWSTGLPMVGEVTTSAGPAGGEITPLEGSEECLPLPALWPETTVRVEVSGTLPKIPSVESYYVATGVADLDVYEARTVEEVVLSGPMDADAEETLRLR